MARGDMSRLKELYSKIDFGHKLQHARRPPMVIGDVSEKEWRKCEALEEYQCNEECFFESAPFYKFWSRGTCRSRDISKLIYDTFCHVTSYKTKEELVKLLRKLAPDESFSNRDKREYLCGRLGKITVEISKNFTKEDQHIFWNSVGMNPNDLEQCFYALRECHNSKFTFYNTYMYIYRFLRKHKKFLAITTVATVTMVLILYYFAFPYIKSYMGYDNLDPEPGILGEFGIHPEKLSESVIVYIDDESKDIFQHFTQEVNEKGFQLDLIAGKDRVLTLEEIERFKQFEEIGEKISDPNISPNFCDWYSGVCSGNLGIERSNMPQIMKNSIHQFQEELNTLNEQLKTATEDMSKRILDNIKYIETAINGMKATGADEEYVPYEGMLSKLGVRVTQAFIKAKELIPTQNEVYITKTYKMASAYYHGKGNDLLSGKIPTIIENIGGHVKNYILDGHHRWSTALIVDPDLPMTCNALELPQGMSVTEFIQSTLRFPGVFRTDLRGNLVM